MLRLEWRQMSSQQLLTTQQVAVYLGVPIATIHRWRYVGTGPPAIRVGRHLRFDPDDLAAWIGEMKSETSGASTDGARDR